MKPSSTLVPLLAAAYASAHGFVASITVGGRDYRGNSPGYGGEPSVVRQVINNSPIEGVYSPDISCGNGAQKAALEADANPGDTVSFLWLAGQGETTWPHRVGPLITYMASCGEGSCVDFDSAQAKWFKIDETGFDSGNQWVQNKVADHQAVSAKIPSNLAPGSYLIRHEISALHNAGPAGGAEIFPSCSQLKIGGQGSGKPSANELVDFPGAYSETEPGLTVNGYAVTSPDAYQFPGPKIASLSGSAGGGGKASGHNTGKILAAAPQEPPVAAPSTEDSEAPAPQESPAAGPATEDSEGPSSPRRKKHYRPRPSSEECSRNRMQRRRRHFGNKH